MACGFRVPAIAIVVGILPHNRRFAQANTPALNGVRESGVFAWTPGPPLSLVSTGDLGIASTEKPYMGTLEISRLNYNGHVITDKDDMLSLTDMWIAGGRVDAKRPANWARKEGAEFIEHMHAVLNVPHGHIIKAERGKGGATFAHWQIGLAYAKYLSPEFHMWCNSVVRERMEGKTPTAIPADVLEMLRRTDGIAKMLARKVTEIERAMPTIVTQALPSAVAGYIAEHNFAIADGVTAGEACDLAKVATTYPRGLSGRVSRRLALFCARNGEKPRVSRLGRVRAQLFPTHLVREWLDVEGRTLIKKWIEEKSGQGKLRLVSNQTESRPSV